MRDQRRTAPRPPSIAPKLGNQACGFVTARLTARHTREIAKELKREGWYAWASDYANIILRIERVRAKAGTLRNGSTEANLKRRLVYLQQTEAPSGTGGVALLI